MSELIVVFELKNKIRVVSACDADVIERVMSQIRSGERFVTVGDVIVATDEISNVTIEPNLGRQ